MTDEYIENIRLNNYQEFIFGEYKKGRYTWVLTDITPLEIPLKVKGQLGIRSYYNELEITNLMKKIEYGWIDKYNQKHYLLDDTYASNYKLQSPQETIKNKVGVCWNQVELEKYSFKNCQYHTKMFFLVYYSNEKCPAHTFLTFEKDNKYY